MRFEAEHFNATWRFVPDLSKLSSPAPRSWFHTITTDGQRISIHEEIEREDGTSIVQTIEGRLDGGDYPILGSPAFDTVAYRPSGATALAGTGKKNGATCLTETMTVDPAERKLTLVYNYLIGGLTIASGLAVFRAD